MDKTVLSRNDLAMLEKIISGPGNIVYFDDLKTLFEGEYSIEELRKRTSLLVRRGWLVRIKRGAFAVANLESHSFAGISPLVVSTVLVPDSYVSFEFALRHHGLFDQMPSKLTALTRGRKREFEFQGIQYSFRKIKPDLFFGYEEVSIDRHAARVAALEKALLDYLYFRLDTYSAELVREKLMEGRGDIDHVRLVSYSNRFPLTVQRRLGFLMDLAGAPSGQLYKKVKGRPGYGRLTRASDRFDAKWRLYYEDRFAE